MQKPEKHLITEYLYWPAKKPSPEGWNVSDALATTNHGEYSKLLWREVEDD